MYEVDKSKVEEFRNALRNDPTHRNPKSQGPSSHSTLYRPNDNHNKHQSQSQGKGRKPSPKILVQWAIQAYEWIDELFKSLGVLMGGIATSLADWVLGAVTMTILLSGYTGMELRVKWATGAVFSLALWGMQIVLWRLIFTGKIKRAFKSPSGVAWIYILVFGAIALMKFGDDISDVVGVFWMIKDNPMQYSLSAGTYNLLRNIVLFLAWCICGFAEVFVAISLGLLKDENKN